LNGENEGGYKKKVWGKTEGTDRRKGVVGEFESYRKGGKEQENGSLKRRVQEGDKDRYRRLKKFDRGQEEVQTGVHSREEVPGRKKTI